MTVGIYCYIDKTNNDIVYVGKDSYIDTQQRHKRHLRPDEYDVQQINRVLQNHPNRYQYKILKQGNFTQNLLNALEIIYIYRYKPKFNYTIGGEGRLLTKEGKIRQSALRTTTGIAFTTIERDNRIQSDNNWFYTYQYTYPSGHRIKIRRSLILDLKKIIEKKNLPWKIVDDKKARQFIEYDEEKKHQHKKNISKGRKGINFTKTHCENISKAKKGKYIGHNNPNALYTLWDINFVAYNKTNMFQHNRIANPCKCFYLRFNTHTVPIGMFIDPYSCEIIGKLIQEAI